jgi:hypothetical protein
VPVSVKNCLQKYCGLMQLEEAYVIEITKLVKYVDRKADPPI